MPSDPLKSSITLDQRALLRWSRLATLYSLQNMTALTRLIEQTAADPAWAEQWREYITAHRQQSTGSLHIVQIQFAGEIVTALGKLMAVAGETRPLSQFIRDLLAFWTQLSPEMLMSAEFATTTR